MRNIASIRISPLIPLLVALLLLAGETLAVSHDHAADGPGAPCMVCTLAKNQIGASDAAAPVTAPVLKPLAVRALPHARDPATPLRRTTARGPPSR